MASTNTRSRSSGGRRTASATKKKTSAKNSAPIRREVGAVICLFLALFSCLGYFNVQALFIDFFCNLIRGLFGYGFYLMPPMFLVASIILMFHRGRPVRRRLICALLLPVPFGGLLHLFLCHIPYQWSWALFGTLYQDGLSTQSGGVISGGLALAFSQVFSSIGAGMIFVLAIVLMLFIICNKTFADLIDAVRNRPEPIPYEEEPPREPRPKPPKRPAKAVIDLPVDDPPQMEGRRQRKREKETLFAHEEKKQELFDHNAKVPAPDVFLRAQVQGENTAEESVFEQEPPSTPAAEGTAPESAVPEVFAPSAPEPGIEKVKPEEAAAAAEEVKRTIESAMGQSSSAYHYPPVSLLTERGGDSQEDSTAELRASQIRLEDTIQSFGIDAKIINVVRGPSVTRYELELDRGVKLNKLTNLADDIALSLGASGVRIAPIPNKISVVGVEVPNKLVSVVSIHEVIDSPEFRNHPSKVAFAIGKDIAGTNIVGNIGKLPHLLIAGTTGSGKSVCMNSLIVSLLYKATPEEVRLIMIDPKMIELGIYNGIPHLLIPVVTDPKKAAGALQWAVTEMMKRYRLFSELNVRDIASYNAAAAKDPQRQKLPQIVIVIDELADLMLVAAKDVEESVCRIAQMARAAGMHLIIATQRPSADVITGIMKANIPSRIAFAVASAMESRIILDTQGAEKLVGRGDMLYFPLGAGKPIRVQGCMITGEEVEAVAEFVKQSGGADYAEDVIREIEQNAEKKEKGGPSGGSGASTEADDGDELLPAAVEVVVETGQASVSMLQRRLKLGYSRAARLVDQMEERGIVGPFEGSKPRQLLITKEQWQEMQLRGSIVVRGPEEALEEKVEEPEAAE